MKENKGRPKQAGTCFDDTPCAEMMEKITGQKGIGSLCQEMMRAFVKTGRAEKEGPKNAQNTEAGEKDDRPGSPADGHEDKDPITGGRK